MAPTKYYHELRGTVGVQCVLRQQMVQVELSMGYRNRKVRYMRTQSVLSHLSASDKVNSQCVLLWNQHPACLGCVQCVYFVQCVTYFHSAHIVPVQCYKTSPRPSKRAES
jgi:hypothetical protein